MQPDLSLLYLLVQARTSEDKWHRFSQARRSSCHPTDSTCQSSEQKTNHWPQPVSWPHLYFICCQIPDGKAPGHCFQYIRTRRFANKKLCRCTGTMQHALSLLTTKITFKLTQVIGICAIRSAVHDFLLVFHCNYVSMLHRFWHIAHFPKFQEVTWLGSQPFKE